MYVHIVAIVNNNKNIHIINNLGKPELCTVRFAGIFHEERSWSKSKSKFKFKFKFVHFKFISSCNLFTKQGGEEKCQRSKSSSRLEFRKLRRFAGSVSFCCLENPAILKNSVKLSKILLNVCTSYIFENSEKFCQKTLSKLPRFENSMS